MRQPTIVFLTAVLMLLSPDDSRAGTPVPVWVQRFPFATPTRIAVDQKGNVFLAGYAFAGMGAAERFVIKYSSSGVVLWTNGFIGPLDSTYDGPGMAADTNGNAYLADFSLRACNPVCDDDYLIVAYAAADGLPMWTNRYAGHSGTNDLNDQAQAVAVDGSGNVYVTGWSGPTAYYWGGNYVTIAYTTAGVPLWTNVSPGAWGNYPGYPAAIACDSYGHIYTTGIGCFAAEGCAPGYLVAAYSNTGVPLWAHVSNDSRVLGSPEANGGGQRRQRVCHRGRRRRLRHHKLFPRGRPTLDQSL